MARGRKDVALNTQDYILLTELYKYKSISKASEALFVSQPALTRRLKQIEEEFSATILIRSSKGISFTPQGELLVDYAREMLTRYDEIQKELAASTKISGTLRIASSLTQTQFFLPELLQNFSALHPGVSYEVETDLSTACVKALNSKQVHVALFRGEHFGVFEKELLATHCAYIVYSQPFSLSELPTLPYISFVSDHSSNTIRESWWYNHFDAAPYTVMTVKNSNICYEMVRHGLGFGIFLNTDLWINNHDLYYKKLYYKDGTPVTRNDWLGFHRKALSLRQIAAFVEYAKEYADEMARRREAPADQNF